MASHLENLKNLCRTCGTALSGPKRNHFNVKQQKVKEMLSNHLYIHVDNDSEEIHPPQICLKCYSKLKNAASRNTTSIHQNINWIPHHPLCEICLPSNRIKKGRPTKSGAKHTGRPSKLNSHWNKENTNTLKASLPKETFSFFHLLPYLSDDVNLHLELCLCLLCKGIMKLPVLITTCQHSFCFTCLMKHVEGHKATSILCPSCNTPTNPESITHSRVVVEMRSKLKFSCRKCGMLFPIESFYQKNTHEASCKIFSVNQHQIVEGNISSDLEVCTMEVIKSKMARSNLPNNSIEINTGGPRVRHSNQLIMSKTYSTSKIFFLFIFVYFSLLF